jgi:hypothetical protein
VRLSILNDTRYRRNSRSVCLLGIIVLLACLLGYQVFCAAAYALIWAMPGQDKAPSAGPLIAAPSLADASPQPPTCSRIAESNPHGARHLQPLHLAASMPDVQAWVAAWVGEQSQARLLRDTRPGFLHARILTFFFGFADDFMASLRWAAPWVLACCWCRALVVRHTCAAPQRRARLELGRLCLARAMRACLIVAQGGDGGVLCEKCLCVVYCGMCCMPPRPCFPAHMAPAGAMTKGRW